MAFMCNECDGNDLLPSPHDGPICAGNVFQYLSVPDLYGKRITYFLLIAFFRYEVQHLHRNGGIVHNVKIYAYKKGILRYPRLSTVSIPSVFSFR